MKKFLFVLAVVLAAASVYAKEIVIFHTSDTHGYFYPQKELETGRMRGGFAAAKSVVNKETRPYILLDGGDYSNGTAEVKNTKGAAAIKIMNAMGYSAAAIGNHEFDFGEDNFLKNLNLFNFSVLSANAQDSRTEAALPRTKPYQIFDVGGVKIAVIGIGKEGDNKFIKLKKASSALRAVMPEVLAQNPAAVVLLIHDSYGDDKHPQKETNLKIAHKVKGLDIVLGGHAHKEFQNIFWGSTIFVESGANLKNISKIIVDIDDVTGKYKSARSELIPLYIDAVGEDAGIKQLAESLRVPGLDIIVGKTTARFERNTTNPNCFDSPLNDWIVDVMAKDLKADFYVHNTGGARISLPQGDITMRDMISLFPFDNKAVLVEADGRFIKNFVRNGLKSDRTMYTYHGLTAKFKIKNNKVRDLEVFIQGKPVENNKTYVLATNEYIAKGYTEGWMFKKIADDKKTFLNHGLRDALIENLKKTSPITPKQECRLERIK